MSAPFYCMPSKTRHNWTWSVKSVRGVMMCEFCTACGAQRSSPDYGQTYKYFAPKLMNYRYGFVLRWRESELRSFRRQARSWFRRVS